MQLNALSIRRVQWGEREGQLDGEVSFINPKGDIKLLLTQEQTAGILTLCADAIVKSTQECAAIMTANVLNVTAQLAAPEPPHD
jgi:hypothetical protein